jgi:ankyrin repeat protein
MPRNPSNLHPGPSAKWKEAFVENGQRRLVGLRAILAFKFYLFMRKLLTTCCLFFATVTLLSAQNLLNAVEAKDYKMAGQAIRAGEDVNEKNDKGMFPLWSAVWNGDAKMVEMLIKAGGDARQKFKGEKEISLLDISAQEGPLEVAQLLVRAGCDVNEKDLRGQTPLRIAARNGRTDIVKYFLSKGADVDTKGDDGATPLEHAASKGHLDIVKLLVDKGANVNLQDKEGDFPLGEAARHGFIDVVNYLLNKGADTNLKNQDGNTAEELARLAGQAKIQHLLKQKRKA